MGLSIDQVAAATAKKGSKGSKVGVRVTEKVAARAEEEAGQACISVRGMDEYRGDVMVRLGDDEFVITKNDTHAAWATKQGDNLPQFVQLFNQLAQTPNKVQGEVAEMA